MNQTLAPDRPRVLVAEDDRALADIIRLTLSRSGFAVSVAHDGLKALRLAEETAFETVCSDFQMPGLDGEQLLSGIRAGGLSHRATLILCSAKSYELDSERLRERLNLAAIFYKPFSLAELISTVRAHAAVSSPAG